MSLAEIRVGDVVTDLVEGGKMQVLAVAADSVADHRDSESYDIASYKAHPLLDVGDDEPVYTCVYLSNKPSVTFSGTYDFPESRLARQPVEEANADYQRIQDELATELLADLFVGATKENALATVSSVCDEAGFAPDIITDAREIAQARLEERGYWDDGPAAETYVADKSGDTDGTADGELGDFNAGVEQ